MPTFAAWPSDMLCQLAAEMKIRNLCKIVQDPCTDTAQLSWTSKKGDCVTDIFHQNGLQRADYVRCLRACPGPFGHPFHAWISLICHSGEHGKGLPARRQRKPDPPDGQVGSAPGQRACLPRTLVHRNPCALVSSW